MRGPETGSAEIGSAGMRRAGARGAARRRLCAAAAVLGLLALTGCGQEGTPEGAGDGGEAPEYEVADGVELSGSPTWEAADEAGRLRIGVKFEEPGLGSMSTGAEAPEGFDIEIAKIAAGRLGFAPDEIEWIETVTPNRETFLQSGNVDLVVGTYTITDERREVVDFAGPYYVAGQDLLVAADSDIRGPEDLAGRTVCATDGSTPGQRIAAEHPEAELVAYDSAALCYEQLQAGAVEAVTTDDAMLRGFAAMDPESFAVVGRPFSEEPYGIGLPKGDDVLREALNDAIESAVDEGDWEAAFAHTLGDSSGVRTPVVDRY